MWSERDDTSDIFLKGGKKKSNLCLCARESWTLSSSYKLVITPGPVYLIPANYQGANFKCKLVAFAMLQSSDIQRFCWLLVYL